MKKIIVIGFPHSGTTILRCKLGECANVHDVISESSFVQQHMMNEAQAAGKDIIVIKWPFVPEDIMNAQGVQGTQYESYQVIFILRNPYYVFSSLTKRFFHEKGTQSFNEHHTVADFEKTLRLFWKLKYTPVDNVQLVIYEDMFNQDSGSSLQAIFKNIGLTYQPGDIVDRTHDYFCTASISAVPCQKPDNAQHEEYRTWQVNQTFQNMNVLGEHLSLHSTTKTAIDELDHLLSLWDLSKLPPIMLK